MGAFYHLDEKMRHKAMEQEGYRTKSIGDSFVYMMSEEIETMAVEYELKILHHLTSDGNSLVRGANFNAAQKEE